MAHYVSSSNLDKFNIQGGTCGPISPSTTLAPGASCTFTATFAPTSLGLVVGSFTLQAGNDTSKFQLKGNGVYPRLLFSPYQVNFGTVPVGTLTAPVTVKVTNYTDATAHFINESGLRNFSIQGGTCGSISPSTTLAPGASCTFTVEFSPKATGYFVGSFTLSTGSGPVTFKMTGTGI